MSTARHQLAGAPGTGTTIDNMASRAKAWASSSTSVTLGGFNVTSFNDIGLGRQGWSFVAPFAAANYAVATQTVCGSTGIFTCVGINIVNATNVAFAAGNNTNGLNDVGFGFVAAGDLA